MKIRNCAAAAAALSLLAGSASATILTVTFTGTLSEGYDQTGRFGAAGTDLTGAAFSVVEYFDTTKGVYNPPPFESISGGTDNGIPGSPGSGSVTVNGVSASIAGGAISFLSRGQSSIGTFVYDHEVAGDVETYGGISAHLNYGAGPPGGDFTTNFHGDCLGVDTCYGVFNFGSFINLPNHGSETYYTDSGKFLISTFDITGGTDPVSGVPEPATWAMMLVGFGMAGATVRRRRALPV